MAMLIYQGNQTEINGECVLGRHRDCGVVVQEGGASRQNTRVYNEEGCWWVEDLKSANGTRHNGTRLEAKERLRNGDSIRIGEAEIAFFCSETESVAAQRLDPQSLEGREVAGYRIGQLLGRSGLGFLYRAQQISLQRQVAFKVFARRVVAEDPQFAGKFRELAARSGKLVHDSFVKLHENGEEDGLIWYSMELVQGDTLAHLLTREQKFQPELALLVCERVALALAEAHKLGIIHRDLAPRTVMLTAEGAVKILDLGIASALGRWRDRTRAEAAWHSAPEVATKAEPQPVDDVYSLGCMMFHLLVGRPPYSGGSADQVLKAHAQQAIPSLQQQAPSLGAKAEELFQTMVAKNPEWRPHDMTEIATALKELREHIAQSAVQAQDQARKMLVRVQASKQHRDARLMNRVIVGTVIALAALAAWVLNPSYVTSEPPIVSEVPTWTPPVSTPVAQPPIVPVTGPTTDAFAARFTKFREQAKLAKAKGDWLAIESELAAVTVEMTAGKSTLLRDLGLLRDELADAAAAWFQAQIKSLPAQGGARLTALARLRDQAGTGERADADARYQQALSALVQQLNESRRQARRALESGRPADLPALANSLAPAFAGTPVIGLQRHFATLCSEATRITSFWKTDWRTTSAGFERQSGEAALAAAAALLIVSDPSRAKRVLLSDGKLAQGELLRRREALLGGLAAVLSFEDPGDLQYIDITYGDPLIAGGALSGKAADATSLLCSVPIGGNDWEVDVSLTLATAGAEAVISCVKSGETSIMIRIAGEAVVCKTPTNERSFPSPVAGARRLRLSCRGGDMLIVLDGRTLTTVAKVPVPVGSQLSLGCAGSDWRLEELQVVGGR